MVYTENAASLLVSELRSKNLSVVKLATKAKISYVMAHACLSGKKNISLKTFKKLSKALSIPAKRAERAWLKDQRYLFHQYF